MKQITVLTCSFVFMSFNRKNQRDHSQSSKEDYRRELTTEVNYSEVVMSFLIKVVMVISGSS